MTKKSIRSCGRPLIYFIAGEVSGDLIGAAVIREIKFMKKDEFNFAGVGGEKMSSEGLQSLFPISELAVMGIFELVPHIPKLMRRIHETAQDIIDKKPLAVITVSNLPCVCK